MNRLAPLLLLAAAACSNAPSFEGAYGRGVAALDAGDARTARVELLNAIKANPNSRAARLKQAEALIALGDGAGAKAELERARELGLSRAATAHLMAHALLLLGDPQAAADEARQAAPEHEAYAQRMLGRALMAAGDNAGAAAAFDAGLRLTPDHAALLTDIARLRRADGDLADAIRMADRAVAADPEYVEALVLRGELTRTQYGLKAALAWFDRALEAEPDHVTALLERAVTLGDMGRMTDMLADTRAVLALEPRNAMAYYLQAMLAARAGKFPLAAAAYERTRGRLEHQPAALLLAGAIDYETGKFEAAVERFGRLIELQPDNLRARRLLAAAHWRMGNFEATAATLSPIVDRPDADSYSLTLMGKALARLGNAGGAAHYLARAASPQRLAGSSNIPAGADMDTLRRQAAQGGADAQVRLVRGLIASGLGEEALQEAEALRGAHPGAPEAHVLTGDALALAGRFDLAAEAYRRAANLAFTEANALRLVEALQRAGRGDAAGEVLALFLDQNPRSVPALLIAAGRQLQARNFAAAVAIYEGLRLRLGDRDAALLNNLAWAYTELGDYDRALPVAKKAWALDPDNAATADTFGWLLVKSGRDRARGLALLQRSAR